MSPVRTVRRPRGDAQRFIGWGPMDDLGRVPTYPNAVLVVDDGVLEIGGRLHPGRLRARVDRSEVRAVVPVLVEVGERWSLPGTGPALVIASDVPELAGLGQWLFLPRDPASAFAALEALGWPVSQEGTSYHGLRRGEG